MDVMDIEPRRVTPTADRTANAQSGPGFGKSSLVRECLDGSAWTDEPPKRSRPRSSPMPAAELVCCATCLRPGAARRCGRCRRRVYCSRDCQRADWAKHKKVCAGLADGAPAAPPVQSLEDELAVVYVAAGTALARAGLDPVASCWDARRLEVLCDDVLLPVLRLAPADDRPHEGLGLGLRTLALLFLRCGARPTCELRNAVAAHASVEAGPGATDPAAFRGVRRRPGPYTTCLRDAAGVFLRRNFGDVRGRPRSNPRSRDSRTTRVAAAAGSRSLPSRGRGGAESPV